MLDLSTFRKGRKERKGEMTRRQDSAKMAKWKELLAEQAGFSTAADPGSGPAGIGSGNGGSARSRQGGTHSESTRLPFWLLWTELVTRVGKLELRVPQDRQGRFRTEIFERYQRSEKALVAALSEMYVQGVSTRKVKAVTEECVGMSSRPQRSAGSTRIWMRS